jgi:hypothetical protein
VPRCGGAKKFVRAAIFAAPGAIFVPAAAPCLAVTGHEKRHGPGHRRLGAAHFEWPPMMGPQRGRRRMRGHPPKGDGAGLVVFSFFHFSGRPFFRLMMARSEKI